MIRSILLLAAAWSITAGQLSGQSFADRSSIAVSGGGIAPFGSAAYGVGSAAAVNLNYEFRIFKFLSIDTGDEAWFPETRVLRYGSVATLQPGTNLAAYKGTGTSQLTLIEGTSRSSSDAIHATLRGLLPLADGKMELFAGVGPGYAWNTGSFFIPGSRFVGEAEAGGRISLDKDRRFWLGLSTQFFGNWRRDPESWAAATVDFRFVFGRKR